MEKETQNTNKKPRKKNYFYHIFERKIASDYSTIYFGEYRMLSPEETLLYGILELTKRDLQSSDSTIRTDAIQWLKGIIKSPYPYFSFESIVEYIDLPPKYIKQLIKLSEDDE